MLLDAPTAGRRRRRPRERVHYRPAAEAIPDEPGRVLTIAAVSLSREAEGMEWIWDDRIETGVALLKRVAYKRAHGEKSAVFACAFAELVYALGAAGGFPRSGPPPRFRGPDWEDYFKRNRTTAQRWCQRAHASGLLAVVGENDNTGQWWRVLVRVLAVAPAHVDAERLSDARGRVKGFSRRRERSDRRGVVRDLRKLAAGAEPLSAAEKKRRRLATQKANARRVFQDKELLRQPKEAEHPPGAPRRVLKGQTFTSGSANRRGAHARGLPSLCSKSVNHPERTHAAPAQHQSTPHRDLFSEGREGLSGSGVAAGPPAGRARSADAAALGGSTKLSGPGAHLALLTAQIASTAPEAGHLTSQALSLVVDGWWQLRRGLPAAALPVVEDTAAAIDGLGAWRRRAASLERLADHRPAGWPTSGAAMLFTLAVIRDLPPGGVDLSSAADALIELMHGDHAHGGRAVKRLGSHLPPAVPAGYEGIATMRRRLTDQLTAAGDSLDAYPTLAAAERAAIEHENTGRLQLGAPDEWDAPWNVGRPSPTLWPSPTAQRSWRHRLLPPLPADFAPPAAAAPDHLADPAFYAAAIKRIRNAPAATRVTWQVAEDLLHAFHAERWTPAGAIARRDWRPRPKGGLAAIQTIVDEWEQLAEHRPDGWSPSGLAAILDTAIWRDPGSYQHDGTPVRLQRPGHLPMALGLLRRLIDDMKAAERRSRDIQSGKRRRRGRGGRSPEHHARKTAKQTTQAPPRFDFRTNTTTMPPPAETPDQTYTRIRRQLLAAGHHPADYPSLEDAELALIDLEHAGVLPADLSPSPTAARQARIDHARSTGPAAIAATDWQHLAAAAGELLVEADARRMADIEAVSIHDGRLILTGSDDTLEWAKAIHLRRLLEHVARQLQIAHSATFVARQHAPVFRPTTELRGPADHRAARADRYSDERHHRYAIRRRS